MYWYAYVHFTCEYSHLSISMDKSFKRPAQVSRNYHLQHVCWQILTHPCLSFVHVVAIHRLFCITIYLKIQSVWFYKHSLRYPGPRGFLLFFLGKFCDANRFCSFFFYWHEALRAKKRKPMVKTVGILTFMPSPFERRL